MKNYTFNDWLHTNVVLKYDYFIPSGETPIIVGWEDFNESDIVMIKETQKNIFDKNVNNHFERFKSIFLERYSRVELKEVCLDKEIKRCEQALFAPLNPEANDKIRIWNAVFDLVDLLEIHNYYDIVIEDGESIEYDFIHPEGSKYFNKDKIPTPIYCTAISKYYEWLKEFKLKIPVVESKFDLFTKNLEAHGFFLLQKIKHRTLESVNKLIKHCFDKGMPYTVAMFEYLDFFEYLENNHFTSKNELNIEVAKWFNVSKDGRSIKGNRATLSSKTDESKKRYTAYLYKEEVKKYYETL